MLKSRIPRKFRISILIAMAVGITGMLFDFEQYQILTVMFISLVVALCSDIK